VSQPERNHAAWISVLIPRHFDGTYPDDIRLATSATEEQAYRDLLLWCEDAPEFTTVEDAREFLGECEEIRHFTVQEAAKL
jgi:hypothetical protein